MIAKMLMRRLTIKNFTTWLHRAEAPGENLGREDSSHTHEGFQPLILDTEPHHSHVGHTYTIGKLGAQLVRVDSMRLAG